MKSLGGGSWLRPRFTLAALLLLITLCAPFLAYLSYLRRQNDLRKEAYQKAIDKGMLLKPTTGSPPPATQPDGRADEARKVWATLLGDPKLPNFGRVQIHDFFGKNRPRPPITDKDLESLQYLPEIEDFYFYYSKDVTDQGLSVLGKLPKLKRLTLNDLSLVTGEFLDSFKEDCVLETIHFSSLQGLDGRRLKSLSRLRNLKTLSVHAGPGLDDESLREVNLPPSVTDLNVGTSAVGDETISRWLSQLNLERLTLRCRVSRGIAPALAKQTQLHVLELSNAPLLDEDFEFLKNFPQLKALQLSGLPLRGKLLDHLACPEKVDVLELDNMPLTDDCLPRLAKFKALKILSLAWTPLSGEGFDDPAMPMPWSLSLAGVRMSDAGKEAFAKCKGLRDVSLPSNWSPDDDQRFVAGNAPTSASRNGYFALKNSGGGLVSQSYMPALRLSKIDNCPADLMKPVAELQAMGLAEDKAWREWDEERRAKP